MTLLPPVGPRDLESSRKLIERYEAMRQQALGGQPPASGMGLALLVGRGIAAWMEAASEILGSPEKSPASEAAAAAPTSVPEILQADAVRILAQIVLAAG